MGREELRPLPLSLLAPAGFPPRKWGGSTSSHSLGNGDGLSGLQSGPVMSKRALEVLAGDELRFVEERPLAIS